MAIEKPPGAWVDEARKLQAENRFEEALACWRTVIARLGERANPHWFARAGHCLEMLKRPEEAEAAYRAAAAKLPDDYPMRNRLVRVLLAQAVVSAEGFGPRRDEIVALIGAMRHDSAIQALRMAAVLLRVAALVEARALIEKTLPAAQNLEALQLACHLIPLAFDKGARIRLLLSVAERPQALAAAAASEAERARALRLDAGIRFALHDYDGFADRVETHREAILALADGPTILRMAERARAPLAEVFAEPKIFGIGLSKTATTSLGQALVMLGLGNGDFFNPLTSEKLDFRDYFFLDSATDGPRHHFETLYYTYPNARFVWTTRPFDSWKGSIDRHFQRSFDIRATGEDWLPYSDRLADKRRGLDHATDFYTDYLLKGGARAAYDAFEARVRNFFADKPAEKLLVMDVFAGDGWGALCGFLGLPEPEAPFPWANRDPAAEQEDVRAL